MIVKKIAKMKKAGQGSFAGLADYLMDVKHEGEKVMGHHFSNCNFENDFSLNIKEIHCTQQVNTTAKSDTTYHLIVAFQEDENPSLEIMQSIEAELVKTVGFEDNQRLSVIHDNTNNLHMHIAINRIDPQNFTCKKEMLGDIRMLQEKAAELEEKYGLKKTNHVPQNREPVKIKDKEIHTGVKSFLTWIKESALQEIKDVIKDENASLETLQKSLNKYNLELRERGAGLVISDKSRVLYVKASDVDRDLSKSNLIKRFGTFTKISIDEPIVTKFGTKSSSLWDEYKTIIHERQTSKKELLDQYSHKSKTAFTELKNDYAERRALVKSDPKLNPYVKREVYRLLNGEQAKAFQELKITLNEERSTIYQKNRYQTYTDFLIDKAAIGNVDAVKTLHRKAIDDPNVNALILQDETKESLFLHILPGQKPHVSKSGSIFYKIDGGKIIDTGRTLKLVYEKSETAFREFMDLAKIKFGTMNTLLIQGNTEFKNMVYVLNESMKLGLKLPKQYQKIDYEKSEKKGMEL